MKLLNVGPSVVLKPAVRFAADDADPNAEIRANREKPAYWYERGNDNLFSARDTLNQALDPATGYNRMDLLMQAQREIGYAIHAQGRLDQLVAAQK